MWIPCLIVALTVGHVVHSQRECEQLKVPQYGFLTRCTNGLGHMSVCSMICEPGYEMKGVSRMLCWCGTRSCVWRGSPPTCEAPKCEKPSHETGRIIIVDQWPKGFLGMVEMSDITHVKAKITSGWSVMLQLDRPLGPDAMLESWNAEVSSASFDKQTFTLSNTQHNADLTSHLDDPNFRWAFKVNNIEGELPKQAFLGLFDHRISDARCYKPTQMRNVTSLPLILDKKVETVPTSRPESIETTATVKQTSASTSTTPTSATIATTTTTTTTTPVIMSTTTTSTTSTTTTSTTSLPTTLETSASSTTTKQVAKTKSPKKNNKKAKKNNKKRNKNRKGKNKSKNKSRATSTVISTTSLPATPLSIHPDSKTTHAEKTTTVSTAITKFNGRYCKLQTHREHYKTQEGWEDLGESYFSGNAILNVTDHLLDWSMLMVFDFSIAEMQVWSVTITEKSSDGKMWTFGPHDWNKDLYMGFTDINFIAKQTGKTPYTPIAKIYLCSLAFTEGDSISGTDGLPDMEPVSVELEKSTPTEDSVEISSDVNKDDPGEEKKSDVGSVPRWKKPSKISKRCMAESPNGVVPKKQAQAKPDFKPNDDNTKYNYNEVLHKSMLFYETQRAGKLPKNNRIPWRGDSTLKDGCDIGVDLSGGWFDAGDHVKFALPMASSVSLLAWGGLMFEDAYKDAGELKNLRNCVKWPAKYLIQSHISEYEFVAQVGSGKIDHATFGRPEEMRMKRPTYVLSPENPGSEPTAEAAAALTATSLLLKKINKPLAKSALKHAEQLFEFADTFRGVYHESVPDVKDFYFSFSGYKDELVWAAAWLYKATKKQAYLDKATKIVNELGGRYVVESEISWDRKLIAAQILLANLTGEEMFRKPVGDFIRNVMNAPKTPKGLMWLRRWGPNRYAANTAFMIIAASTLQPPLPDIEKYVDWAAKQIHLILGDIGRSYVVGFGNNYPVRVHHRASTCRPFPKVCNRQNFFTPQPNYYVVFGAVVGGPDKKEMYSDNRLVYEQTEVACDYNAGFQSAVAGLKHHAMKRRTPAIAYAEHDLRKWSG